jgi:allene oxide cyclase
MRKTLTISLSILVAAVVLVPQVTSAKPKPPKVKTISAYAVVDTASAVDNDPAGESIGDTVTFTQKIYTDSSKTTQIGTDEAFCARTVPGTRQLCTGIFYLDGGAITITGPETTGVHSLAITGGTGKYLGASGEVVLNSVDAVSDEVKIRIIR